MKKVHHRDRIERVRTVVMTMPDGSVDRKVSVCYMLNFSDMDIRDELDITKTCLLASRQRIRQMLIDAGVMIGFRYTSRKIWERETMGMTLTVTRGKKEGSPRVWHKDDGAGKPLCMPSRVFGKANVTLNPNEVTCSRCRELLKHENQ